jgi:predicted small secreted protein
MLRLLIILILGTTLSACNLFEKHPQDKSIPTLEGTDPNGSEITYISQSGYHAVRLNDQPWNHVSNELQLKSLSEDDILTIVKLCEANSDRPAVGLYSEWKIKHFSSAVENNKYENLCTGHNQDPSSTTETITLKSQQKSEGIEIVGAILEGDFFSSFNSVSGSYSLSTNIDKNKRSIIAIGYGQVQKTAYVYKGNLFSIKNGDTINIDFLSENSHLADVEAIEKKDYDYSRQYCEVFMFCIELSFNTNESIRIKYPETLKGSNGSYAEHWQNSFYINSEQYEFGYRTSSNDEPINYNPLEGYQPEIKPVEIETGNSLTVQLPLFTGFENAEWQGFTVHKYSNLEVWSDYIDASSDRHMEILTLDLSKLPNIPPDFDQSPLEMISAEQHLNSYFLDLSVNKNHSIELTVPIPTAYFQSQ